MTTESGQILIKVKLEWSKIVFIHLGMRENFRETVGIPVGMIFNVKSAEISCTADEGCDDGNHGFHVHEASPTRDASGQYVCATAGGHFRKEGQVHSKPDDPDRYIKSRVLKLKVMA